MIIDLILDRKDNEEYCNRDYYKANDFYTEVMCYGEIGYDIARAMDYGTNEDVRQALCKYIYDNEYNPSICYYINKKQWL